MLHMLRALILVLCLSSIVIAQASQGAPPTTEDLKKFLDDAETRLNKLNVKASQANWVQETYITDDTQAIAAAANDDLLAAITELAEQAKRFERVQAPPELQRKLLLLKLSAVSPAPSNPAERAEMTQVAAWLDGTYGKGKYCPKTGPYAGKCLSQNEMETAMAETRDPAVLLDLWTGWHTIAPPMKQKYTRFVELSNKGAKEMGF